MTKSRHEHPGPEPYHGWAEVPQVTVPPPGGPSSKSTGVILFALGGLILILIASIGVMVSVLVGRSGGDESDVLAESIAGRPVIFGVACQNRTDLYGRAGLINIAGEDWERYRDLPDIPPLEVILGSVDMADEKYTYRYDSDVDLDLTTLSPVQQRQLYASLTAYVKDEQRSGNAGTPAAVLGDTYVHLYGSFWSDSPQDDGRVDSPDLNVCVANE